VNDPSISKHLLQQSAARPADPPRPGEALFRYLWQGRFGQMLIEVDEGRAYVNGQFVEPAVSPAVSPDGTAAAAPTVPLPGRAAAT